MAFCSLSIKFFILKQSDVFIDLECVYWWFIFQIIIDFVPIKNILLKVNLQLCTESIISILAKTQDEHAYKHRNPKCHWTCSYIDIWRLRQGANKI